MSTPAKPKEDLAAILGRLRAAGMTESAAPECPGVQSGQACNGTFHFDQNGRVAASCQIARYRNEAERHAVQLARCGVSLQGFGLSMHEELLRRVDTRRDPSNVDLSRARQCFMSWASNRPAVERGNVVLCGSTGTAKTMLMLGLYFADILARRHAVWIGQKDLRELAQAQRSFDHVTRAQAASTLGCWQRASVLYIDDLADRQSEPRTDGVLLDLLNGLTGRLVVSTNLEAPALREHPDVGTRVVSRLFADYVDVQAVRRGSEQHPVAACIFNLLGTDQRQHQLRSGAA